MSAVLKTANAAAYTTSTVTLLNTASEVMLVAKGLAGTEVVAVEVKLADATWQALIVSGGNLLSALNNFVAVKGRLQFRCVKAATIGAVSLHVIGADSDFAIEA